MPFVKGHRLSVGKGRPFKSKNILPDIRDKVLNVLKHRLNADKELSSVSTEELLQFARSIMPKDVTITANPSVTYISNVPRPYSLDAVTDAVSSDAVSALPIQTDTISESNTISESHSTSDDAQCNASVVHSTKETTLGGVDNAEETRVAPPPHTSILIDRDVDEGGRPRVNDVVSSEEA